MNHKLGDFNRWFEPCKKCGHDPGKVTEKCSNKCWKCGSRLTRDYSDRALKKAQTMTDLISITILVHPKDIEIDAIVEHYPELPDEPEDYKVEINKVSVTGLGYDVDSYDVIDIENLAVERYKESNNEINV